MGINSIIYDPVNLPESSPPANPSKQVEIKYGDTIESVAKANNTTPQKLLAANPQVTNPDHLYPGEMLNLPEESSDDSATGVSVTVNDEDTTKTGDSNNGTTSKSKTSAGVSDGGVAVGGSQSNSTTTTDANGNKSTSGTSGSASVTVDPEKGTVSASAGTGFSESVKNAKGVGVSFGIDGKATVVTGKNTKDGVTTYTASSDVSVTVSGGVDAKQAGIAVAHTEGIKSSYEVSMPEQVANNTDLNSVSPFDPSTMPTGTVIKIDGSSYTSNEFKATFKNIALQTKVTNESGTSMVVEKTGDTKVRVTVGPTEAVSVYNGIGVDFDAVKVMLGNDTKLSSATLKTAEFDLSTPEGQAAYNDFLATGNMPADNGPGVADVKTIEKLDYSSQAKIDAKIGPVDLGVEGAKNTGNTIVTTYPDGTIERTVQLKYGSDDGTKMAISQKYDADGKEIVSERRYSYTIKADENTAQFINTAQTGDVNKAGDGPVKAGDTVTITYTQAEMEELLGDAKKSVDGATFPDQAVAERLSPGGLSDPVMDFAVKIVSLNAYGGGTDYATAELLFNISSGADGDAGDNDFVKLPGTVTVQN